MKKIKKNNFTRWVSLFLMPLLMCLILNSMSAYATLGNTLLKKEGKGVSGIEQKTVQAKENPLPESSPHSFVQNLNSIYQNKDYDALELLLDLRHLNKQIKETQGKAWAQKLMGLFQSMGLPHGELLSRARLGNTTDGLPFYRDLLKIYRFRDKSFSLYIDRVKRGMSHGQWLISPASLYQLDSFYDSISSKRFLKYLPSFVFEVEFLGINLFSLFQLFTVFLGAWVLTLVLDTVVLRSLGGMLSKRSGLKWSLLKKSVFGQLKKSLFFLSSALLLQLMDRSFFNLEVFSKFRNLFVILAIFFPFLGAVDFGAVFVEEKLKGDADKIKSLHLGRATTKFFLYFLFGLIAIQSFGLNLTAIFAGLGVGGIAVALAGQKTMENLFGGLSILMDRPVAVGDYCAFDGRTGTVEKIGLRSIKIRTLDRTLISIPNSKFSEMEIENYAWRDSMRLKFRIGVLYDTKEGQLKEMLRQIREYLKSNPEVSQGQTLRVHLVHFADSSYEIEIYCYIKTAVYNHFMQVQEEIRFKVINIVKTCGSDFAFPTRTLIHAPQAAQDKTPKVPAPFSEALTQDSRH